MVNCLEDAPSEFFKEFYVTVCDFYGIDPDLLFIHLMEEAI